MIKDPVKIAIKDVYYGMIKRCYDSKDKRYKNYGERGVKVCDEWKKGISIFREWALNNGWRKGLQLDKDIIGDGYLYSPETCCFVTPKQNGNNKTSSVKYDYNDQRLTLAEIADIIGIKYKTLHKRVVTCKIPLEIAVKNALGTRNKDRDRRLDNNIILNIYNSDLSYRKISKEYNISVGIVASIKQGRIYSKITGKLYKQ